MVWALWFIITQCVPLKDNLTIFQERELFYSKHEFFGDSNSSYHEQLIILTCLWIPMYSKVTWYHYCLLFLERAHCDHDQFICNIKSSIDSVVKGSIMGIHAVFAVTFGIR